MKGVSVARRADTWRSSPSVAERTAALNEVLLRLPPAVGVERVARGVAFGSAIHLAVRGERTVEWGFCLPMTLAFLWIGNLWNAPDVASLALRYAFAVAASSVLMKLVAQELARALEPALYTAATGRLVGAPGSRALALAHLLFSGRTNEQVFEPLVADMRFEHFEALRQGQLWRARIRQIAWHWHIGVAACRLLAPDVIGPIRSLLIRLLSGRDGSAE